MPDGFPPIPLGSSTKPPNTMTVFDMEGNPLVLNLSKKGWMPPIPSRRPIGNTLSGREDQYTLLDSLSPKQRALLTDEMTKLLSKVPTSYVPGLPRTGYYYEEGNKVELREGVSRAINLHEGAHAYDASKGWAPSSNLPGLDYQTERDLYNRYYGKPEVVDTRRNIRGGFYVSGLPPKEKFATLAQHGPYAIPSKLRNLFSGIYAPLPAARTYRRGGR